MSNCESRKKIFDAAQFSRFYPVILPEGAFTIYSEENRVNSTFYCRDGGVVYIYSYELDSLSLYYVLNLKYLRCYSTSSIESLAMSIVRVSKTLY